MGVKGSLPDGMGYTVDGSTPVRRGPVRAFNRLCARCPGLRARFAIEADALLDKAVHTTRLDQYGDPAFIPAFRRLVDAIQSTAMLNDFGQFAWYGMLHTLLCNRLFTEERLRRDPRLTETVLGSPLFVLGLPRTGSTFLHILLACDPSMRFLSSIEALRPQGDPRKRPPPRVLQRANARFSFGLLDYLAPGFRTIHDEPADGPAECGGLLLNTFETVAFLPSLNIPEYAAWLDRSDYRSTAAYHSRQLNLLNDGRVGARWILKSPAHLPMVDALIEAYPQARFVFLHRDPAKVVPSFCSLVRLTRGIYSDIVDAPLIGQQTAIMLEALLRRALEARQRHDPTRFIDVFYRDLVENPLGTVSHIYRQLGWEVGRQTRERLDACAMRAHTGRHRTHRYGLEPYGLERGAINERFSWYTEAFDITHEP